MKDPFGDNFNVTDQPPLLEGPPLAQESAAPESTAEILPGETPNRVQIQTHASEPGLLILADAYYPGWQADIDGAPASVYPVDGLLRGVHVEAGFHTVTFTYRSSALQQGAMVSVIALLCLFLAALVRRK